MVDVSVVGCDDYSYNNVQNALTEALSELGGLDWVKVGMKIAIKANLVAFLPPDRAATTHPSVLAVLVRMLVEKGASVVIGDSPGGLYNSAYVGRVYSATGMHELEAIGGKLNRSFETVDTSFPDAKQLKSFTYTSYLDDADVIINVCKLKSHGMMGMSCAVKNMFGVIPGTMKPEYHFRFPKHSDFADMLVDINEYFAPKLKLCICDAVIAMEGNGPTAGTPRKLGAILASASPYKLDLVAARLIGQTVSNIPTLEAAYLRGLAPSEPCGFAVSDEYERFIVSDFASISTHTSLEFKGNGKGLTRIFGSTLKKLLRSKPKTLKSECVGCGVCRNICPAKAIEIKDGIAVINRKGCIRCFCCQEFCPKGAMIVKRTVIARIFVKSSKKS